MSVGRDLALVASGVGMGAGLTAAAQMAWAQFSEWRKGRDQWFRKQKGSNAPGPAPAPQPTLRPIKGQRVPAGAHRPKQSTARFAGRVRRRVVPQPSRVSGPSMHLTDESQGGDPTYG